MLAPALAKQLRERRLATLHKSPHDFVFTTPSGQGLDYRRVGRAFRGSVRRAGLQAPGRLSLHSLRHGFASLLIAKGLNVVYVSRQLGHANPSITLEVYAHLFDRADHAAAAKEALEADYEASAGGLGSSAEVRPAH